LSKVQSCLFLLCILVLGSCDHAKPRTQKSLAQDFLDTIDTTLDAFGSSGENFATYLEIVTPIALNNPNTKLDKKKIDSLRNYYDTYMNSLAEGISTLSNLKEFDTSFNIVAPCLYFLKKTKEAYTATFPSYFRIYEVGWDKVSEADRQIWLSSPKVLHEANLSSSKEIKNLGTMIKGFRRKYALSVN
jgi:hypothetical protein